MRCHVCEESLVPQVAFCPSCGTPLVQGFASPALARGEGYRPRRRSFRMPTSRCTQSTTMLLAAIPLFCFGLGGIHHFYTGRIGFGVLQFLTLGGLFIWAICDMVSIARGEFRDVEERPLART